MKMIIALAASIFITGCGGVTNTKQMDTLPDVIQVGQSILNRDSIPATDYPTLDDSARQELSLLTGFDVPAGTQLIGEREAINGIKLKAYATRDDYYNDRNYSVATRTITVTSSTPTTPSRAYVSRIVLTNWPARQNGNVWDQFATTSTTHPDIQIRIMNGTTELFRSEVVDNCIHPSDGGTTYPSFNVGVTLTASTTYTIDIYDEDSFDFVEMGSGTINLASLGSPNYPTTIECSNAHFSFRIYLTWSY